MIRNTHLNFTWRRYSYGHEPQRCGRLFVIAVSITLLTTEVGNLKGNLDIIKT